MIITEKSIFFYIFQFLKEKYVNFTRIESLVYKFLYFKIDGNYIYVENRFINHKKETIWFEIFVKKFTILIFFIN